jgi:hypothetical protein
MPPSPTLIGLGDLRDQFEISEDIRAGRLENNIKAASRRLRAWVGAAAYDDALSNTPTDEDRREDLRLAEANLAMHVAVAGLNTNITPGGVVKTAKVEGSTVLTYLTPHEVKELKQLYLDQAEEIARPYLLADGTPAPEFMLTDED